MRAILSIILAIGVSHVVATPSLAQTTPAARSSGGLFGATRSNDLDRNWLNVSFSLSEAYDTELPLEHTAGLPQNAQPWGGYSTILVGDADYERSWRRLRIAATADAAFRYYDGLDRTDAVGYSGGFGAHIPLPGTASLRIDQSAAYSPSYLYQLFPVSTAPALGDAIVTAPDYQVLQTDSYDYRSNLTFTAGSTRGTSVTASGSFDRTDFQEDRARQPKLNAYSGRAAISHRVTRNVGLSVDYSYRTGDFADGTSNEHRLAFGAEYSRPLSTSRRATFRLNVTPSTLHISDDALSSGVAGRIFRLQGDASVSYPFRRTWQVSANVGRRSEYLAVLGEPVLSDAARLSLEGLLTRRLELLATAAYAEGASALNRFNHFDSYTGNVRLRFALSRGVAIYGEYLYFSYDYGGAAAFPPDLPRAFEQHGLRIGATLWVTAF